MAVHGGTFGAGVRLGLLFGLGSFGCVLSWLWNIFGAASICLWLILALFMAVFGGVYAMLSARFSEKVWLPVLAACLWTGLEWYRGEMFILSFSWVTPGLGLGPTALSPWIGVYGMSWVIVLGGVFLISSRKWAGGVFLVIALLLGVGFHVSKPAVPERPLTVRLLQNEDAAMDDFVTPSLGSEADIVVWPEYAVPFEIKVDSTSYVKIRSVIEGREAIVVFGTKTPNVDDYFNTAMTVGSGGILGRHYKCHTVHLFSDGTAGETSLPVETPFGNLGTPICFDCDHSDVVRGMAANGAVAFAVPSMDPVGWSARQHALHGALFRHRAAENGRWMAVASTSGMTQIIDYRGKEVASLPLMEPGLLDGVIGRREAVTFYTRAGWLFGPVCGVVAMGWIVGIVVVRGRRG
jgi:apolipoprotein N-acyltransferase